MTAIAADENGISRLASRQRAIASSSSRRESPSSNQCQAPGLGQRPDRPRPGHRRLLPLSCGRIADSSHASVVTYRQEELTQVKLQGIEATLARIPAATRQRLEAALADLAVHLQTPTPA